VVILLWFLFLAVAIAIVMHLHFKNAPNVRVALVSPPVFAIAGCLIGISVGMMWLWDDTTTTWTGRIHIEQGVVHALAGAAVGGLVGMGVKAIFARLPKTRIVAAVLTLMILAASIGAPIGWLYGDVLRHRAADDATVEAVQSTRSGMIWGSAIGCVVGLVLGLSEAYFGGRIPKADAATQN
jgi:hypothetical protein